MRPDPQLESLAPTVNPLTMLSFPEFLVFLGFAAADALPVSVVLAEMDMPPKGYTGPLDVRLGILMLKMLSQRNMSMVHPPQEESEALPLDFSDDTGYDSDPETGFSATEQRLQQQKEEALQKSSSNRY